MFAAVSCDNEQSTREKYKDWRQANAAFFTEKDNSVNAYGEREYMRITPIWDAGSYILMKKLKSGSGTRYPLFTSTVDVTYKGYCTTRIRRLTSHLRAARRGLSAKLAHRAGRG